MLDFKSIFEKHKTIFLHGKTRSGKTSTILNYMNENNKDYSYVSIQDLKNERDFTTLLQSQNVYKMFFNSTDNCKNFEKYIIIDNIDYLQNNDKKMIGIFIKFFKQKHSNKYDNIYIIFIGSNLKDKKVQELITYTSFQYEFISYYEKEYDKVIKEIVCDILNHKKNNLQDTSDKNIISLCYHENIILVMNNDSIQYEKFLRNFCNGDYYDRMSFKKQLWQLNEITFYLKVIVNSYLLENNNDNHTIDLSNVDFTKILTKFSNEYSNYNFLINICNRLKCQKEVLFENIETKTSLLTTQEYKRICKLLT